MPIVVVDELQGDSGGPVMILSGPRFTENDPESARDNRFHLVGVGSSCEIVYNEFLFVDRVVGVTDPPKFRPTDSPTRVPMVHHPFTRNSHTDQMRTYQIN